MVHCPSRSAALLSLIFGHPLLVVAGHHPELCQHHSFGSLECSFPPTACASPCVCPQSVTPSHCPFLGWQEEVAQAQHRGVPVRASRCCTAFDTWDLLFLCALKLLGRPGVPVCVPRCGSKAMSSAQLCSWRGLNPACCRALSGEPTEGCKHELVLKTPGDNTCGNLAAKWNSLVVN